MNDRDYAIVVGINKYPQLPRLWGAHKDATDFAAWLTNKNPQGGKLPKKNVELILSADPQPPEPPIADVYDPRNQPLKRDIDRALRNFKIEEDKPIGRRFYFYFSGHGLGLTFNDVAMLMADATGKALNNNIGLMSYLNLFLLLQPARFEEVVFILDCCRDHSIKADPMLPAYKPAPLDGPLPDVKFFVILAAAWGAKAFEEPVPETKERRGVLTRFLLKALRDLDPQAADGDKNITCRSLFDYLERNVPQIPTQSKEPQTPTGRDWPPPNIVFCTLPETKMAVRITTTASFAGTLVLRLGDSVGTEIDRRTIDFSNLGQAAWEIDLPINQLYSIEHIESGKFVALDMSNIDLNQPPYVFHFQ